MFPGVLGQPGRCATCVEPNDEHNFRAHRYNFVLEIDHQGCISVTHVPSEYQHEGILTKAL